MKKNKTNLNAVDQRIYKYWEALYLAFYSRRLYIDVGKRWRGFGLIYFFLVIAIASIPLSIKSMRAFTDYYNYKLMEPLQKTPSFEIRENKLVFDNFMPYLVKNKYGDVAVILDDKASLTEINSIYPQWMMFITSDRVYMRVKDAPFLNELDLGDTNERSKQVAMQLFTEFQSGVFNGESLVEKIGMTNIKWKLLLSIYPSLTGFMYGVFAMLFFFLAVVVRVMTYSFFKFKISFKCTYRMLLVASSPGVSLFIISLNFGQLPWMGLYLVLIIALYFFYAVLSLRQESKQMVLA